MNKLKIYLRTQGDISEQAKTYSSVFEGKILKKTFLKQTNEKIKKIANKNNIWTFVYLEVVNDINILIAKHKLNMNEAGYQGDYVLSLKSKKLFDKILNNMKESSIFRIDYDVMEEKWGTQIAKFYDKWGYGWIIETKS